MLIRVAEEIAALLSMVLFLSMLAVWTSFASGL
jgi:hypothetical protein